MLPNSNLRKTSIQQSQGSQSCYIEYMFPYEQQQKIQKTWNWLEKYYDKKIHYPELINFCFRNHKVNSAIMYNKFRNQFHSDLEQPLISQFFNNKSFPDLIQIGKWFKASNKQKYPVFHIPPAPKQLQSVLDQIFNNYGYIPNLERFLLLYPNLLCKMHKFKKHIFGKQMQMTTSFFISIYAAAELGSVYMMNRMINKYRHQGGDMEWISQGSYPKKFKVIFKLARKLGRASWQIDSQLISQIIGDQQQQNGGGNYWTHRQLVIITQIIVFVQFLSTVAIAMGLKSQKNVDILNIEKFNQYLKDSRSQNYNTEQLQMLSTVVKQILPQGNQQINSMKSSKKINVKKSFNKTSEGQEVIVQGYMKQIGKQLAQQKGYQILCQSLKPFMLDFEPVKKRREHIHPKFDYSQYNFNFHAYPYLQMLVPQISNGLADLVTYIQDMTSNNFGKIQLQNADTKQFRRGVRFYSQNLVGYTHFNYYQNLKKYLTLPLKFYIRLLTLSPMHITKQVLKQIRHQTDDQLINCLDLGHLAILVSNSKMVFGVMKVLQNISQ